ncbi:carboxymuconolactone decarboxylase family protein [Lacimicrobium alkaliphilum]|uniref:Carboxymuconolactone decarboxylase-like domain-containing protein n=1 Tax=Lacimicrobium alkaliphilum TaxID=1526571 RepID=A0ABQ1RFE2_9ALTE|nr:carboxymuconolactone decarboxylase family protein [Lacimicrobium alkaliphilum]GGD66559.1 hypothetical protein GCM10011357_22280 [Lacimicrobium alkaliphilum]
MSKFPLYDKNSAPEDSKKMLEDAEKSMGMVPNLFAVMAGSPAVLEAYQTLNQLFTQSGLSDEEQTVVWQTINITNDCHYCVPAHTAIAHSMKIDQDIIDALRNDTKLQNNKLEVLRTTVKALLNERGRLNEKQTIAFYDAGFNQAQLMEVVLGISQKTLSNYINHLAATPLDKAFDKFS